MYKSAVLIVIWLLLSALIAMSGYGRVEKPVLNGKGPLAIKMDEGFEAPEEDPYNHRPLANWQKTHMEVVNNNPGIQEECLDCHEPNTSCNNCHSYVGVKPISSS